MRDPLSYGVVEFKQTKNQLGQYFDDLAKKKADAEAAKKKAEKDQFEGMERLGGVWERDVESLTKDFLDFKKKRVEYEQEKDPTKKATLWQEGVKMGVKLETNIEKSKKNKQQYIAKAEEINKDNKLFLPEDATERLDKWASTSIYDRPDNIGIERPSTLDFIAEANKKFKSLVGDPNIASDKTKTADGTMTIEKGRKYYTPEDVDRALESTLSSMPANFIRSERKRLMDAYNYGMPSERIEAEKALKSPEAEREYFKKILYAAVQPGLTVGIDKTAPATPSKAGGAGGDKGMYNIETSTSQFGGVTFSDVRATKKSGKDPERKWQVPTSLLKEINKKYKLNLDTELAKLDPNVTPYVSIDGVFLKASRNENTGEMTVTIDPKRYADKYFTIQGGIALPIEENLANINAQLEGQNVIDLFNQEKSKGVKASKPAKPRKASGGPGSGKPKEEEDPFAIYKR